jgi:hypothetical protein
MLEIDGPSATNCICTERSINMRNAPRPTISLWLLFVLLVLLGVGAAFGGFLLVIDPTGVRMQWSIALLEHSPFQNFLIPGLILGIVFGIGSFVALLALWFRPDWSLGTALTRFTGEHWSWSLAFALGLGQVIWIIAEVLMVRVPSWLQPACAALGVLIMLLTLEPGFRRYLALEKRADEARA